MTIKEGESITMDFTTIKEAVPIREAAGYYGINVKSNGMCRCPFHDDRTPSMKLYDDNYYCFGCGAHGDVIDLAGRLYGLTARQAAEKIITDFGLDIPTHCNLSPPEREKRVKAANEALGSEKVHRAFSLEMRELRQKLVRCKEKLDKWKYSLAPADSCPDPDSWDDRFVTAHIHSDLIDSLIDTIDFGENDERFELFLHRKEVADHAERLISDREPDGRHL